MIPTHQTALLSTALCRRFLAQKNRLARHKRGLLPSPFTIAHLLASLTALALVGCGGGGTDKSSIPVENTNAFLVSSVPVTTYTGQALRAFDVLNAERARCGFGQLAQNSRIDTAADSHSVWMLRNGIGPSVRFVRKPATSSQDADDMPKITVSKVVFTSKCSKTSQFQPSPPTPR